MFSQQHNVYNANFQFRAKIKSGDKPDWADKDLAGAESRYEEPSCSRKGCKDLLESYGGCNKICGEEAFGEPHLKFHRRSVADSVPGLRKTWAAYKLFGPQKISYTCSCKCSEFNPGGRNTIRYHQFFSCWTKAKPEVFSPKEAVIFPNFH